MGEEMSMPKTWEEFLYLYEFEDLEERYTNGATLISSSRVKQMVEHYFNKGTSIAIDLTLMEAAIIVRSAFETDEKWYGGLVASIKSALKDCGIGLMCQIPFDDESDINRRIDNISRAVADRIIGLDDNE